MKQKKENLLENFKKAPLKLKLLVSLLILFMFLTDIFVNILSIPVFSVVSLTLVLVIGYILIKSKENEKE